MTSLRDRALTFATRARYVTGQGVRTAWYGGQYALARRMSAGYTRPGEPTFSPSRGQPSLPAMRKAFFDLFEKDRANIEAGLYPAPKGPTPLSLWEAFQKSRRFFDDLPKVDGRRLNREGTEVRELEGTDRYPVYYRQNFHYQSGGWFTEESAELYDTQVEILFTGAAEAMRRQVLAELAPCVRGRDQRQVKVLDLACGTGGFLHQMLDAFPRLAATGLELSPAYAAKARRSVKVWPWVDIVEGQAEAMPFEDDSFDVVTNIYLFHELPPKVRPMVAREIARVLKPGGHFLFADSLQFGDTPDLDGLLEYFPHGFHEPYYNSYLAEDLVGIFGEAGLSAGEVTTAFLTKVQTFELPTT